MLAAIASFVKSCPRNPLAPCLFIAPCPSRPKPSFQPDSLVEFIPLQLATLVDAAPVGEDWLHEIKNDGYRTGARLVLPGVHMAKSSENDMRRWLCICPLILHSL